MSAQDKTAEVEAPFFLTEEIEAEMKAQGTAPETELPNHARTESIRNMLGWRPGETLQETIARTKARAGS